MWPALLFRLSFSCECEMSLPSLSLGRNSAVSFGTGIVISVVNVAGFVFWVAMVVVVFVL